MARCAVFGALLTRVACDDCFCNAAHPHCNDGDKYCYAESGGQGGYDWWHCRGSCTSDATTTTTTTTTMTPCFCPPHYRFCHTDNQWCYSEPGGDGLYSYQCGGTCTADSTASTTTTTTTTTEPESEIEAQEEAQVLGVVWRLWMTHVIEGLRQWVSDNHLQPTHGDFRVWNGAFNVSLDVVPEHGVALSMATSLDDVEVRLAHEHFHRAWQYVPLELAKRADWSFVHLLEAYTMRWMQSCPLCHSNHTIREVLASHFSAARTALNNIAEHQLVAELFRENGEWEEELEYCGVAIHEENEEKCGSLPQPFASQPIKYFLEFLSSLPIFKNVPSFGDVRHTITHWPCELVSAYDLWTEVRAAQFLEWQRRVYGRQHHRTVPENQTREGIHVRCAMIPVDFIANNVSDYLNELVTWGIENRLMSFLEYEELRPGAGEWGVEFCRENPELEHHSMYTHVSLSYQLYENNDVFTVFELTYSQNAHLGMSWADVSADETLEGIRTLLNYQSFADLFEAHNSNAMIPSMTELYAMHMQPLTSSVHEKIVQPLIDRHAQSLAIALSQQEHPFFGASFTTVVLVFGSTGMLFGLAVGMAFMVLLTRPRRDGNSLTAPLL